MVLGSGTSTLERARASVSLLHRPKGFGIMHVKVVFVFDTKPGGHYAEPNHSSFRLSSRWLIISGYPCVPWRACERSSINRGDKGRRSIAGSCRKATTE
jgi:hypothetical protein